MFGLATSKLDEAVTFRLDVLRHLLTTPYFLSIGFSTPWCISDPVDLTGMSYVDGRVSYDVLLQRPIYRGPYVLLTKHIVIHDVGHELAHDEDWI